MAESIPISEARKPFKGPYWQDHCPECGKACEAACRCMRNDRWCGNKHTWERNHETGEAVLLDGPHGEVIKRYKAVGGLWLKGPDSHLKYWTCFAFDGIEPDVLHCTHKYLGKLNDQDAREVQGLLEASFQTPPGAITVVFDREDWFDEDKSVRVLVPSADVTTELLPDLKSTLDAYAPDKYPDYKPHVSTEDLARVDMPLTRYCLMRGKEIIAEWPLVDPPTKDGEALLDDDISGGSNVNPQRWGGQLVTVRGKDCVGDKIAILMGEGYDQDQAIAIAYSMCGEDKSADKGLEIQNTPDGIAIAWDGIILAGPFNTSNEISQAINDLQSVPEGEGEKGLLNVGAITALGGLALGGGGALIAALGSILYEIYQQEREYEESRRWSREQQQNQIPNDFRNATPSKARTIAVDLDGTLAEYDGWKGEDHFGDPLPGAKEALQAIRDSGDTIIIFTTRGATDKVADWLNTNGIPFDYINENPDQPEGSSGKVIADVYIDDRAIAFEGWDSALRELDSREAPKESKALSLPDIRQQYPYDCGAAAVLSVLQWVGDAATTEEDVLLALGTTPENGTDPQAICSYLNQRGFNYEDRDRLQIYDLAKYTAEGCPVICCIQDYEEAPTDIVTQSSGHWVVVTDANDDFVTFQDPNAGVVVMPAVEFLGRWDDYAGEAPFDDSDTRFVHYGIAVKPMQGVKAMQKSFIIRVGDSWISRSGGGFSNTRYEPILSGRAGAMSFESEEEARSWANRYLTMTTWEIEEKSADGSISYETPFGTFGTWEEAANRVEQADMDPTTVISIVKTKAQSPLSVVQDEEDGLWYIMDNETAEIADGPFEDSFAAEQAMGDMLAIATGGWEAGRKAPPVCPQCGAPIVEATDGHSFCTSCGWEAPSEEMKGGSDYQPYAPRKGLGLEGDDGLGWSVVDTDSGSVLAGPFQSKYQAIVALDKISAEQRQAAMRFDEEKGDASYTIAQADGQWWVMYQGERFAGPFESEDEAMGGLTDLQADYPEIKAV